MTETEESTIEDENNVTSNVTSNADTEAGHQEDLVLKRWNRNSIYKSAPIYKTCRQQDVTSDSNRSYLF